MGQTFMLRPQRRKAYNGLAITYYVLSPVRGYIVNELSIFIATVVATVVAITTHIAGHINLNGFCRFTPMFLTGSVGLRPPRKSTPEEIP